MSFSLQEMSTLVQVSCHTYASNPFPSFFLMWFQRNITSLVSAKDFNHGFVNKKRSGKYNYLLWLQPPEDSQFGKSPSYPGVAESAEWSTRYHQTSSSATNKERRAEEAPGPRDPTLQLQTFSEQREHPPASSYVTQAQQPDCKVADTNPAMLHNEGQRGRKVPCSTKTLIRKNVHKMATRHTTDHHWASINQRSLLVLDTYTPPSLFKLSVKRRPFLTGIKTKGWIRWLLPYPPALT